MSAAIAVATIVEDPLEVAPDQDAARDLTEWAERHAVDDEVADQRPAGPALERMRVLPDAERAADLPVAKRRPGTQVSMRVCQRQGTRWSERR